MTPEQLARFLAIIAANHQPVDKRDERRVFLSGWNEALDFVERTRKEVMGEKA